MRWPLTQPAVTKRLAFEPQGDPLVAALAGPMTSARKRREDERQGIEKSAA